MKVEAQRAAAVYGDVIDVEPVQALRAVLGITAGAVAWLKARIEALDGLDSPEAQSLVQLYGQERDRLARVAKGCLDAGMKRIEIEQAEAQTAIMGKLLDAVMNELDLTQAQRKGVGPAIRKVMPEVLSGFNSPQAHAAALPA